MVIDGCGTSVVGAVDGFGASVVGAVGGFGASDGTSDFWVDSATVGVIFAELLGSKNT